jgi:hypothetical protein
MVSKLTYEVGTTVGPQGPNMCGNRSSKNMLGTFLKYKYVGDMFL